jgi:16S rRNA (cytosine967-C5)-methyltransferase
LRSESRDWRVWPIEGSFGDTLRSVSIKIIQNVEKGRFLDEAINRSFGKASLSDKEKGLIHEITSGVIRWRGYLEWELSRYVDRGTRQEIRYLLWMTLYQISFMEKAHYHVVNEAVEYAKKERGAHTASFVNGVLRRFIREREAAGNDSSPSQVPGLSVKHSFPDWIVRRWVARFGRDEAEMLMASLNRSPDFGLRVDLRRMSQEEVVGHLGEKGIAARKGSVLDTAVYVERLSAVLKDELFKEGIIHVQDEASQLAGRAVHLAGGRYILDACAGSGTKTAQLKELLDSGCVVSMDSGMKRLRMMEKGATLVRGDALRSPFRREVFDTILVDAPCTSLGIIGKHPEIKWRRKLADVGLFGRNQLAMLKALWPILKPGGSMIYSVCSFEPEETTQVLEGLAGSEQFVLENPLPILFNKEYFLSLPHEMSMDGFFIARLKKI